MKERYKHNRKTEGSRDFHRSNEWKDQLHEKSVRLRSNANLERSGPIAASIASKYVRLLTENVGPPCQRACTGSSIGSPESVSSFLKQIYVRKNVNETGTSALVGKEQIVVKVAINAGRM